MVLTQSQCENMSTEELIQELTDVNSKLQQCEKFNSHLLTKIIQLERNAVTNSQYSRIEIIELNTMPADITEDVLEENTCKALLLTGVNVVPNDLQACHRMKRSDRVIVKFKCCKQKNSVMYKCKNLGNKSQELKNLKFSGRVFVSESMSHDNQQLVYKCRQLKSACKIHSTWFFNNVVNLKLTKHGRIYKIFHVTDIENLLEIDNLEYINNVSF